MEPVLNNTPENKIECDNQSHTMGACVDLSRGVGQSTGLICLVGCNPIRLMKHKEELRVLMKSSLLPILSKILDSVPHH